MAKRTEQTKELAFLHRVERFIGMKEGPRAERVRAAVRLGLATAAAHRERHRERRGTALSAGLHCMTMSMASLYDQERAAVKDLAARPEPEYDLAYLALALVHLSKVVDAVSAELDLVEGRREVA